jgi:hypothetical protein
MKDGRCAGSKTSATAASFNVLAKTQTLTSMRPRFVTNYTMQQRENNSAAGRGNRRLTEKQVPGRGAGGSEGRGERVKENTPTPNLNRNPVSNLCFAFRPPKGSFFLRF